MKPYPTYKDSGIEWIGEIPEHWELKPIKYTSKINDAVLPESFDEENVISYIDIGNVTLGRLIDVPAKMKFKVAPSRARRIVKSGDTLVSTVRTYLKAITHIPQANENLIASTGFAVLTPEVTIPKYLFYYSVSQKFIDRVCAKSVGVSYPAITSSELGNIPIWFPPNKEEQIAIANFLDHKTAQIDAAIEQHRRLIKLLQEHRAALINEAVTKGLPAEALAKAEMDPHVPMKDSGIEWIGEVPEHWDIVKMKYLGHIKYGLGQPPRKKEGGLPIIRATNIERGSISEENMVFVDPEDIPYERDPVLRENDIIVVRSGAYTADSAIIPKEYEGAITGYDMVFRPETVNAKFIAFGLLSNYILYHQLYLHRLRAAQPHLNAEELGETIVLLPPEKEQQKIVDFIETETTRIDEEITLAQQEIDLLEEYRQALIAEAVTGKIDVRDYPLED